MPAFRNWAGTASCAPSSVARVSSEEDIVAHVKRAAADGRRVKVAGSGHSFTDIACTDGAMLRLDGYDRVLEVDESARTATVEAGITLLALAERLAERGLALSNLGDIGYQTLAGAIATGTHGTGARFGTISSLVRAMRLVDGTGKIVECSEQGDPETLRAAQVSLGALGAISTVTLQCEPAFTLHAVEEPMRLDAVLSSLDDLVAGNEHFEFFWFPHTDRCLTKRNNRVPDPPRPRSRAKAWLDDVALANGALGLVCRLGRARERWIPPLARLVGAALSRSEYSDRSDRVFMSPRTVRFSEMEYALPAEAARDAILGVRRLIEDGGYRVSFPVEMRFVAPDDAYLSPAHARASCYVAAHVFERMAYEPLFREIESFMESLGGRPHWGKIHFRAAESLAPAYPAWDEFSRVRRALDPGGVFANAYLGRVLGG